MWVRRVQRIALACALAAPGWVPGMTVQAAPGLAVFSASGTAQAEVTQAARHDVSPPLRDIGRRSSAVSPRQVIPLRSAGGHARGVIDPVVQTSASTPLGVTTGLNFLGIGVGLGAFMPGSEPPDPNGAVGATQFVQWVNTSLAIFDKKTGVLVFGPVDGNSLWAGFGGPCQLNNDGDPIAQYDKAANRWVLTQLAVTGGPPFLQCVAVSQTPDATGQYFRYAFQQPNFNDFPKVGIWPDAYYVTFNMFGHRFLGARACAFERAAMLNGTPARQVCFQLSSSVASLLPSDLDGATAPPAASPNFLLNFGSSSLNLFKFHVDWTTPASSTFIGPTSIPVAAFNPACGGGACIQQPGTTQLLDSLADRLSYRLAYRNFGAHDALVVNHSVNPNNNTSGIRWYELDNPGTKPTIVQQRTYAIDSSFRWMGSIAMDKVGDLAVGYSVSSATVFPSIRIAGRVATDFPSTFRAEASIVAGSGSQVGHARWGDYSSMGIDPVDDCTFWYTTEFLQTTGDFIWSTQIASFKFPACT